MRWQKPSKVTIELGAYCDSFGIPLSALFSDPDHFLGLKTPDVLREEGLIPEKVWSVYVAG